MGLATIRKVLLLSGAVVLGLGATAAGAQENTENFFTMLERLVVGAGAEKVAVDTPQAVTVVDQEDIDRAQATTTGDLFDTVPGVTMVGSERALGEAFNIRGIGTTENSPDGSRIVVNVDGVPKFYEQYRMGSFFSDPELFKQVEVLRGPASSTLYGAGAIGGVINFTTKDASDFIKDGKTGAIKVKGTYTDNGEGTQTSVILAQQLTDTFEVLAAGNWQRQNEQEQADGDLLAGSDFSTLSGLLKGTMHFGDNDEQTLKLSYQQVKTETDQTNYAQTGVWSSDVFGYIDRDVTDRTAVIEWSNPDSDNPFVDSNVSLSFSDTLNQQSNHRSTKDGALTNAAPPSTFADTDYEYRTYQLKADNTMEWLTDDFENYLTLGLQASSQDRIVTFPDGDVDVTTHPEGNEKKLGLFAQNEFVWNEALTLVAGIRGDWHVIEPTTSGLDTRDGFAISPKLSALYQLNDTVGVFGSVAHTERLPTIDELYSSVAASAPSMYSAGNSGKTTSLDLKKEQANSIEAGFTLSGYDLVQDGDSAALKTTAFYSRITDMIASNAYGAYGDPMPSYYGNIDEAELYGFEVEASYNSEWVFANLAYSLTIGRDVGTGDPLTTVPQSKLVATLGARQPDWDLEYGARMTFAAEGEYVVADSAYGADGTAEAWQTLDLFATWKPEDGAFAGNELRFSVDNVFDADYRENLSINRSKGRTFKLTLAKQFDY